MRRPLDWIVVSISLLVLFANRMLAPEPVELQVLPLPGIRAQVASIHTVDPAGNPAGNPAGTLTMAHTDNPFAYIREDGTLQFLPLDKNPPSFH